MDQQHQYDNAAGEMGGDSFRLFSDAEVFWLVMAMAAIAWIFI